MSKLKTIEHNGNILQIGGLYEFSDTDVDGKWYPCILTDINKKTGRYIALCDNWSSIRECQSVPGTIEKKPLWDEGYWVMCKWQEQTGSESFQWNEAPFLFDGKNFVKSEKLNFFEAKYKMVKS